MPRWLAAEIKKGKKREDFAIDKSAAKGAALAKNLGANKKQWKAQKLLLPLDNLSHLEAF